MFESVRIERVQKELDDDEFIVLIPMGERNLCEQITEKDLLNPQLDLAGWVVKRQLRDLLKENAARNSRQRDYYLRNLFDEPELEMEGEFTLGCGGVQIPADSVKGIARTASTPRDANRIVARPLVIVAHVNGEPICALIDSGSLGDLVSTSLVDQLKLKRNELDNSITLQLAMQGSRSKINHSTDVKFGYQDISESRTFLVANISGYDMILGTAWLFQHKIVIGFNPARVCVGSAESLPLEGVATAKVVAGAIDLREETLSAAREELLDYAKPICKPAEETGLPPLRAINHTIPLIDVDKILPWRPSRCPEA